MARPDSNPPPSVCVSGILSILRPPRPTPPAPSRPASPRPATVFGLNAVLLDEHDAICRAFLIILTLRTELRSFRMVVRSNDVTQNSRCRVTHEREQGTRRMNERNLSRNILSIFVTSPPASVKRWRHPRGAFGTTLLYETGKQHGVPTASDFRCYAWIVNTNKNLGFL